MIFAVRVPFVIFPVSVWVFLSFFENCGACTREKRTQWWTFINIEWNRSTELIRIIALDVHEIQHLTETIQQRQFFQGCVHSRRSSFVDFLSCDYSTNWDSRKSFSTGTLCFEIRFYFQLKYFKWFARGVTNIYLLLW